MDRLRLPGTQSASVRIHRALLGAPCLAAALLAAELIVAGFGGGSGVTNPAGPSGEVTASRGAPAAPTLSVPINAATGVATSPHAWWGTVQGATTYCAQLARNDGFTQGLVTFNSSTSYCDFTGLSTGTRYYWRVKAGAGSLWGAWSTAFIFATGTGTTDLRRPTLVSPANGATSVATLAGISWNPVPGAAVYYAQTSKNEAFTDGTVSYGTGTPSMHVPLLAGTRYFWRARIGDGKVAGAWSAAWSFTTASGISSLPPPVLKSPANGATNSPEARSPGPHSMACRSPATMASPRAPPRGT